MRKHWTRECIIRQLLDRESKGLPLNVGRQGIDSALHSAAQRIFGSWQNAIQAAGIAPRQMPSGKRWSPAKILVAIRHLARRQRPLTALQMERHHHNIVTAARRHFGSWNKAVLAAGVDPSKLRRVLPWKPERIIEAILTRALRNDSLSARQVEPRSLTAAAKRFFGSWPAAVAAAGLDPAMTARQSKRQSPPMVEVRSRGKTKSSGGDRKQRWNKDRVIASLQLRLAACKRMNGTALAREDASLYDAMRRYFGNWREAMRAAELDPDAYRVTHAATAAARLRQAVAPPAPAPESLRPDTSQ
jgi:DNA-binding protein H-NS